MVDPRATPTALDAELFYQLLLGELNAGGVEPGTGTRPGLDLAAVFGRHPVTRVTPPDPISQTLLALPIILLYEISIWCVRLIERGRKAEDDAATDIVPV